MILAFSDIIAINILILIIIVYSHITLIKYNYSTVRKALKVASAFDGSKSSLYGLTPGHLSCRWSSEAVFVKVRGEVGLASVKNDAIIPDAQSSNS